MRSVFIVPYFGTFPNYFQLFLNSCGKNSDYFDWIFFTDNKEKYNYPSNVMVYAMTFETLKKMIQDKFEFDISLNSPYKLCDYKPAFGYIFEDYIKKYDFWGHCDIDCILGRLSFFLDEKIKDYDKIMRLGHMILYKNTKENNRRFMLPIEGRLRYKEVFTNSRNCIFDECNSKNELSIDDIWEQYGFTLLMLDEIIANVWYKSNFFVLLYQRKKANYEKERKMRHIFYWNNGELFRIFNQNGILVKQEFAYMHLMKRNMSVKVSAGDSGMLKIIPNAFQEVNYIPATIQEFKRVKYRKMNNQYMKIKYKNLCVKMRRLCENLQKKSL